MSIEDHIARPAERRVTIRFPQVDPAGIVFYPRYFEMAFDCFPHVPFAATPFAIQTDFLRPNRLGDQLLIAFEHAADMKEWSITGRMNDENHFTIRPLASGENEFSPAAHRSGQTGFRTAEEKVGGWTADRHGRMYLSRYFECLEISIEEWLEHTLEIPFHELHVGRRVGIPTVSFTTRCRELPAVGDMVSTWIRPTKIGTRAMTFTSWLVRENECLVENEQVIVFVRMLENGYESIPIPADIRTAFAMQLDSAAG